LIKPGLDLFHAVISPAARAREIQPFSGENRVFTPYPLRKEKASQKYHLTRTEHGRMEEVERIKTQENLLSALN
jgi:hypothetical protein